MISVSGLAVGFSGNYLFEDISFLINRTDKIGLTGRNGAGKSTLMKILGGAQRADEGTVSVPRECRIGYLPQDLRSDSKETILNETRKAFAEVLQLRSDLDQIQHDVATRTDYESDGYMKLLEQLHEKEERFGMLGGYEIDEKTEKVLFGLGFSRADLDKPYSAFSGGWQMRVELAKILLQQPDLLMLDEPTNHLDIDSILWLEDFLVDYPGAVMMVSHDRTFLDKITNRTLEISNGGLQDYKANYSKYLVLRAERREQLASAYKNQQTQIAQIERNVERFRAKASKAAFAQSLIKKLDKIDRIEMEDEDNSAIRFNFPKAPHSGKVVVTGEDIRKDYGDKKVIRSFNFSIDRGDRIAFVGKNGMGKTTLARIIARDMDKYEGKLDEGYNVLLGYFAQHQTKVLNGDNTLLKEMEDATAHSDMFTRVRALLGAFLFTGKDVDKKIKVLSGGERARLAMCKMLTEPLNFLVLDEPTNHLDIRSKEVLKNALMNFEGSFVVVSHDRDFLQGLTNKVFEFTEDGIKSYLGDINEYLERKKVESFREIEKSDDKPKAAAAAPVAEVRTQPADNKKLKQVQNAIRRSEEQISRLEAEISDIEAELAKPENAANADVYTKYSALKSQLDTEVQKWEQLLSEAEG
ncbi:MAG: ABC-F family ATP-binding cassette domain-containing protein [Bacteroidia bacterium]|nr:ABC-F family ATP-binding cassette domain-containing protein [Bacteroidia bacterium]